MNARILSPYLEPGTVDPAYSYDPDREIAFIESEGKRLADAMHARLVNDAPDQYAVAQAFASSSNAALYRLLVLAMQDKPTELIQAVKQLANEAIDETANHIATVKWQRIDI